MIGTLPSCQRPSKKVHVGEWLTDLLFGTMTALHLDGCTTACFCRGHVARTKLARPVNTRSTLSRSFRDEDAQERPECGRRSAAFFELLGSTGRAPRRKPAGS